MHVQCKSTQSRFAVHAPYCTGRVQAVYGPENGLVSSWYTVRTVKCNLVYAAWIAATTAYHGIPKPTPFAESLHATCAPRTGRTVS